MVRQRIIVRLLCGRMGRQQTALRSWALNVINELPDGANYHWATLFLGSPSSGDGGLVRPGAWLGPGESSSIPTLQE